MAVVKYVRVSKNKRVREDVYKKRQEAEAKKKSSSSSNKYAKLKSYVDASGVVRYEGKTGYQAQEYARQQELASKAKASGSSVIVRDASGVVESASKKVTGATGDLTGQRLSQRQAEAITGTLAGKVSAQTARQRIEDERLYLQRQEADRKRDKQTQDFYQAKIDKRYQPEQL